MAHPACIRRKARQMRLEKDLTIDEIAERLGISRQTIAASSGQLRSRTWRCRQGVMAVKSHDTLFRARLQAWLDRLRSEWLDSAA